MTLAQIATNRKSRKGTADGITADGAYWIAVKVAILKGGGDGISQNARHDYLVVRHYRTGELRAYAQRETWNQDGSSTSRVRRDTLLACSTVEEIIQILNSIPLEAGEYETGHFEVTPEGKERLEADLSEMVAALPGPDEEGAPGPLVPVDRADVDPQAIR